MYTIRNVSEAQMGAALEPCLHCKKNVATTPALGTLEVNGSDGTRKGYLHPLCKGPWEAAQQPTVETNLVEKTQEPPTPQPQTIEPRRERKWRYVVVVKHDTDGIVRIPTDVFDEMNTVTQAERRNPDPGYNWNDATVERFPINDGVPDSYTPPSRAKTFWLLAFSEKEF
jgi:hypothetical protein